MTTALAAELQWHCSFQIDFSSAKRQCTLQITNKSLIIRDKGTQQISFTINVHDILSCTCLNDSLNVDNVSERHGVLLRLYARTEQDIRKLQEAVFTFDGPDCEANKRDSELLNSCLSSELIEFSEANDLGHETRFAVGSGKRLLFIINPVSGQQRALDLFRTVVEPALIKAGFCNFHATKDTSQSESIVDQKTLPKEEEADSKSTTSLVQKRPTGTPYEVLITSKANEARNFVHSMDLLAYYAIVVVSGDGLLHEVVNGIMLRSDWREAIRMPLSILPAGTGNCLSANMVLAAAESLSTKHLMMNALFIFLRHNIVPMDIMTCQLKPVDLPLDVGIDRKFSFIGFMWGLLSDIDIESESLRAFGRLRYPIYAIRRILAPHFRTVRGRITYLPASELTEAELHNNSAERNADGSLRFRFLPPLDQIPSSDKRKWCVIEGEFVSVNVLRVSHLVEDSIIASEVKRFDYGFANLFIGKAGYSRFSVLRQLLLFLSGNSEGVAKSDLVIKVPVVAVRIEPFDRRGIITLDGELVPFGTVQMELIPGLARLLAIEKYPRQSMIVTKQD